jgi:pectin methylesterase-like acyl-CoA thioesterase
VRTEVTGQRALKRSRGRAIGAAVLVLASNSVAAEPPAGAGHVIVAASCSSEDVQSAIYSASDGDTVTVPAGTCTWSAAVNINNKTITLRGAGSGAGGTKIAYGGTGHSLISINAGYKTGKMDVSGFLFSGGSQLLERNGHQFLRARRLAQHPDT